MVSEMFDAERWRPIDGFEDLSDITYHRAIDQGTVRIAFDRPEIRNAFRPHTVDELYRTLDHARQTSDVGCVLLTGNGPSPRDGGWAFCSGGDQRIRGRDGYRYARGESADTIDPARSGRLHILEVQRLIRFLPKPVIAVVPGWAAGGGHSLHVVCDLTLASAEHAKFKQTDADVGSFDGGYAEYALVPEHQLIALDTTLRWDVLGALPETFMTAAGSLAHLGLQPGETLLLRGATSSVGLACLQLARVAGVRDHPREHQHEQ